MSRIFICGDTHGTRDVKKIVNLCKNKQLSYDDYIIICGDAGIVWGEELTTEHIKFYENLSTNILFIDGNHEDFNKLKDFPLEKWNGGWINRISEHIRFLKRGQVFNIDGNTFLAMGGADSHDKGFREENVSWWSDETISLLDIATAVENLRKTNFKVDYILSHTPCNIFAQEIVSTFTQCGEQFPPYLEWKLNCNESGKLLDEIAKQTNFKQWFCGHWHIDEVVDKYTVLYNRIYEIKK